MAQATKYSELPGLDTAPDTYETTPQEDTAATKSTSSTPRSTSPSSDQEDTASISRTHLQPRTARSRFKSFRIDAKSTDFSDRISTSEDRGYAISRTRRRRRGNVEELTNGAFSDEDDQDAAEETYEEKLARVQREIEELKLAKPEQKKDESTVEQLAKVVRELDEQIHASRDTESPGEAEKATTTATQTSKQSSPPSANTVQPLDTSFLKSLTSLDSRIAMMESALGVHAQTLQSSSSSSSNNSSKANHTAAPLLPTLALLDRRITALSETSASSLEDLDAQIHAVTVNAQALSEIRRKEREDAAQARERERDSGRPMSGRNRDRGAFGGMNGYSSSNTGSGGGARSNGEGYMANGGSSSTSNSANSSTAAARNASQAQKIDELYDVLPTIETLSPLVPAMLDRLKSLRGLHVAASSAAGDLKDVVSRQDELASEVEKWRKAVERVEELVKEDRGKEGGNREVIRKWVEDLEERLGKLAAS